MGQGVKKEIQKRNNETTEKKGMLKQYYILQ